MVVSMFIYDDGDTQQWVDASPPGSVEGARDLTYEYPGSGFEQTIQGRLEEYVSVDDFDGDIKGAADAAFADDKKLILGSSVSRVLIPSHFPTLDRALNVIGPGQEVEIRFESGTRINYTSSISGVDCSAFTVTSEDSEVVVSNLQTDPIVHAFYSKMPLWDIVLNCQQKAEYGIKLEASEMVVNPNAGVKNANDVNIMVHRNSKFVGMNAGADGLICSGAGKKGIWVTYASSATTYFADFTNNGLKATENTDGYAVFVSRSSSVQVDRSTFSGSQGGIRAARSMVSARQSIFDNISGHSIWSFESGFVACSACSFTNSGTEFVIKVGLAGRDQAGNPTINVEDSTFNNIQNAAIRVFGAGVVNANDCSFTNLESRALLLDQGYFEAFRSTFNAKAGNSETELIIVSQGGEASLTQCNFNGANGVRNPARFIQNAKGSISASTATNFTANRLVYIDDAASCYTADSSINGNTDSQDRLGNTTNFKKHEDGRLEIWDWVQINNFVNGNRLNRRYDFPVPFIDAASTVVSVTLSKRDPNNSTTSGFVSINNLCVNTDATNHEFVTINAEIVTNSGSTFVNGNTVWARVYATGYWY